MQQINNKLPQTNLSICTIFILKFCSLATHLLFYFSFGFFCPLNLRTPCETNLNLNNKYAKLTEIKTKIYKKIKRILSLFICFDGTLSSYQPACVSICWSCRTYVCLLLYFFFWLSVWLILRQKQSRNNN